MHICCANPFKPRHQLIYNVLIPQLEIDTGFKARYANPAGVSKSRALVLQCFLLMPNCLR